MAFDHREGAAASPYAPVMGRTFVALDETSERRILDDMRAAVLTAWADELIPADDAWPPASRTDPAGYIDAVLFKAPVLRPVVLQGIDAVDALARERHGRSFVDLDRPQRVAVLRDIESTGAPEAFSTVFELTYEAYYRAPEVQAVAKDRTGFDVHNTVVGKPMEPFPIEKLQPIGLRPDNYRSVPA